MERNSTHEAYKAEVRRTHALLKPISTEAAAIFYPTLFEVDPSAKVRHHLRVFLLCRHKHV